MGPNTLEEQIHASLAQWEAPIPDGLEVTSVLEHDAAAQAARVLSEELAAGRGVREGLAHLRREALDLERGTRQRRAAFHALIAATAAARLARRRVPFDATAVKELLS